MAVKLPLAARAAATATLAAVLALVPAAARPDACAPSPGFELCYTFPWAATVVPPTLEVDVDFNTAVVNGYEVAQGSYLVRFSCSGVTYYDASTCDFSGCDGELLGAGIVTRSIGAPYVANARVERTLCYVNEGTAFAWYGVAAFDSGVHVVDCYQDLHCATGERCDTSGDPSGWTCLATPEAGGCSCATAPDALSGALLVAWAALVSARRHRRA